VRRARAAPPRLEQVLREDADRTGGRALSLADQNDPVRRRHDVAAFDRGVPQLWSKPPDTRSGSRVAEARVEPVDRLEVERLVLPGGQYIWLIETPPKTQALVSRMNSVFGNGAITKVRRTHAF
jgi:hypothetical protein